MILQVENIQKAFGSKHVLNGISIAIHQGMLIGIVGENGAGKSTLVKILVGLWKADSGRLSINCKTGYCPQLPLVFQHLSVMENFRYFASAYKLCTHKGDKQPYYEQLMKLFRFDEYKNQLVMNLSGGTIQKLNLAIALMHQPDLLILDEPYNGFDWDTYLCFWEYIKHFREEGGSILLVTHLLTDTSVFDQVYNIKKGVLE
ncbi:ABC transporter ATP-binding protein [Labilibacter sediminis]|nr:ABC transporter ATP-binding protein [Labilibacter sediminis]